LSFFDETDEPSTAQQPQARRPRPAGGPRRPAPQQRAIQIRRGVAAGVLLVLLVLIALGVHSCQISARNSALRNYNNNVASAIRASNQTGRQFFGLLSSGSGSSNATTLQSQINETRLGADSELSRARGFDVPDQVHGAQQNLLLALQMRRDGIANIAAQIQPALNGSTSSDAVNAIAAEMARLYGSDAVYKGYVAPMIASALHGAGIAVGGTNGEAIDPGQFLPDVQWLTPSYIASQLRVSTPASSGGKAAPGIHGHRMDSVSVGGTQLQEGTTNTVAAKPPPTFTCAFTNDGQNNETNVVVKVSVSGTSISGQAIVPQTTPGQQSMAQVTLNSSPSPGTYTVTATIERVPGETTVTHNTKTYTVTFQ
jgi:hypothetical protein